MPVAMIAIEALWTDRFHRFRGVMKLPLDQMWNTTQMTTRAPIMPSRRVSISSEPRSARGLRAGGLGAADGASGLGALWLAAPGDSVIPIPPSRAQEWEAPCVAATAATQGAGVTSV